MLFVLVGLSVFLGVILLVAYFTNWTLAIGVALLVMYLLNKNYDNNLQDLDEEINKDKNNI